MQRLIENPIISRILDSRVWALARKEINQILRNKQLIFLLIFPPTIQLLIYGFALSPDVHYIKMGVVDYANTSTSRELVTALTENRIFTVQDYLFSEADLGKQVERGNITAGLMIPPDFDRKIKDNNTAEVQVLIDGVDANTAGIASGYLSQIVSRFSRNLTPNPALPPIDPEVIFLYNPGLISSWFFVPGVLGLVLTLTGSLVSSSTVVREKDTGTLEQLLMTPAEAWEILLAKIVPLFILLLGDVCLALTVGKVIFNLPFRGNLLIFFLISSLYLCVGIGVGILLATISKNQRQVVLTSFFINLPLIQTSGAIAPIESMPAFFRYLSFLNPLRHYVAIARGFLLKGVGVEELWMNILALAIFAIVLLGFSIRQFRNQLS
ncbi:ABC transporter permease [Leptolyngbya ohadii]|uniref:ABC transporter permease n=1 Tax=Leptolyngbya ohadii TaxID=1962290 RepID=UPI000B59D21A|nr:ABC transporter permease [Leptolyngbya ohadii]